MKISPEVAALLPAVTEYRRELHQIPELGLAEYQTVAYLKNALAQMGAPEVHQVLDTALVAVFRSSKPGKTIAFRTDIDALPVNEKTGVDFASQHPGRMHACGHDGHMATMLGFARYLVAHPEVIRGTLVLVFQPAEEGPGGAQLLIDAGVFTDFGVEEIVGLHVFPDFEEGVIACKAGPMMARNGEVNIMVTGVGAHGAQPQLGADAILAASAIVTGLHTIISRNISPLESAVLTFGEIAGGDAMNIIASQVELKGTLRAFDDRTYETICQRLEKLADGIAAGYGCQAEVSFNHMYRVVDNDPEMVAALAEVAGDSYQETPPYMLAEDFSMYQTVMPGLFFFVGIRNEEKGYVHPLHSNQLQFDEKNLLGGIQCYVSLISGLNK